MRLNRACLAIVGISGWMVAAPAGAHTYTWTNGANTGAWTNPANWASPTGSAYPGSNTADVAIIQAGVSGSVASLDADISVAALTIKVNATVRSNGHVLTVTGEGGTTIERFGQLRLTNSQDKFIIAGGGKAHFAGTLVMEKDLAEFRMTTSLCVGDVEGHVGTVLTAGVTGVVHLGDGVVFNSTLSFRGSFEFRTDVSGSATFGNHGLVSASGFGSEILLSPAIKLLDSPGGIRWRVAGAWATLHFNRSADGSDADHPAFTGDFALEGCGVFECADGVSVESSGHLSGYQGTIITDESEYFFIDEFVVSGTLTLGSCPP